jgi:tetratricopeptide (TPR) repeat protein
MNTLSAIDDHWDFGDPAGTAERFEGLLGSNDESYVADVKTQIARTQGLRGLFDEAHATLDEVSSVLPRVDLRVEVRYLLERGRVWNSSGARDKARDVFLAAFDAARRVGDDHLTIDAAHMLAIVSDPIGALEWNLLAFRILESSSQQRAKTWVGALSNNIAWTYHDTGEFGTALGYFEQGLEYRRSVGAEPALRIARWAVARCKRSMGRFEEALEEQMAILSEYFPSGRDESGYVAEEIGECLLALGRGRDSRPYFANAHEILRGDQWLTRHELPRIERLRALATDQLP